MPEKKEYFVLSEKNEILGPFEEYELDSLNLFSDSLISIDSTENFIKLSAISSLAHIKFSEGSMVELNPDYGIYLRERQSPDKVFSKPEGTMKRIGYFFLAFVLLGITTFVVNIIYHSFREKSNESEIKNPKPETEDKHSIGIGQLPQRPLYERERDIQYVTSTEEINTDEFTKNIPRYDKNKSNGKFSINRFNELQNFGIEIDNDSKQITRKWIFVNGKPLGTKVNIIYNSFFNQATISFQDENRISRVIKIPDEAFYLKYPRYIWSFKVGRNIYDII